MKSILGLIDARKHAYYYYGNKRLPLLPKGDRILIGLNSIKEQKESIAILKELDATSDFFDVDKSYPKESEILQSDYIQLTANSATFISYKGHRSSKEFVCSGGVSFTNYVGK